MSILYIESSDHKIRKTVFWVVLLESLGLLAQVLHAHRKVCQRFVNVFTRGILAHNVWPLDMFSSGGSLLFIPLEATHALRPVCWYTIASREPFPLLEDWKSVGMMA